MEYLVKLGLGHLAMSKTILNKISKDKDFGKWLIQNKKKLTSSIYYMDVIVKAYNTKRNIDELQMLKEKKLSFIHDNNYEYLKELFNGKDLERFFFYIQKKGISYSLYTDYITACKYLNLDLSLDKNRFPHDFKKWHDIRIDEYHTAKAIEDEKQRKELYNKFLSVANKYLPLQEIHKGNYICLIAKSPAELVKEGEVLDHCVGRMNYDQKFIREESLIFFVREVDKPDIPFVTMEYSLERHKILQCYAKGDTKPNDQTIQYLDKIWLPFANRTLKRIAA